MQNANKLELLYGYHPIMSCLLFGSRRPVRLFVRTLENNRGNPSEILSDLQLKVIRKARERKVPVSEVNKNELHRLFQLEHTESRPNQSMALEVEPCQTHFLKRGEIISENKKKFKIERMGWITPLAFNIITN